MTDIEAAEVRTLRDDRDRLLAECERLRGELTAMTADRDKLKTALDASLEVDKARKAVMEQLTAERDALKARIESGDEAYRDPDTCFTSRFEDESYTERVRIVLDPK